jgi:hypothetical protein
MFTRTQSSTAVGVRLGSRSGLSTLFSTKQVQRPFLRHAPQRVSSAIVEDERAAAHHVAYRTSSAPASAASE